MTIVLVTEFFPITLGLDVRGGVETVSVYWTQVLLRRQHRVIVLASREYGTPKRSLNGSLSVIRCGFPRAFSQSGFLLERLSFLFHASLLRLQEKPDVIIGMNFLGYLPALALSRRYRVPVVAAYHDVWIGKWIKNVGLLPGILGEMYERMILRAGWSFFIANSNITKQKLIRCGRLAAEQIAVIYNPIDLVRYRSLRVNKSGHPTVCYVGRLVRYKRIDDLLRAFAVVHHLIPLLKGRIIGIGPEEQRLRKLTQDLGLESSVNFLGSLPKHEDVMVEIGRAHLFCLPSAVEGFGIVTIEAMAMGTPYVNTAIPATTEITDNGIGGILYPVGDIQALAEGIIKLISDKNMNERKRREGRAFVERYNLESIGATLDQALLSLTTSI